MHDIDYCRILFKEIRPLVARLPKEIRENAWTYKYSGSDTVEFHINKNSYLPKGFYWYGSGCCRTYAKYKGWSAFLSMFEKTGGRIQ